MSVEERGFGQSVSCHGCHYRRCLAFFSLQLCTEMTPEAVVRGSPGRKSGWGHGPIEDVGVLSPVGDIYNRGMDGSIWARDPGRVTWIWGQDIGTCVNDPGGVTWGRCVIWGTWVLGPNMDIWVRSPNGDTWLRDPGRCVWV